MRCKASRESERPSLKQAGACSAAAAAAAAAKSGGGLCMTRIYVLQLVPSTHAIRVPRSELASLWPQTVCPAWGAPDLPGCLRVCQHTELARTSPLAAGRLAAAMATSGGGGGGSGPSGLRLLFWLAVAILAHVLVALFGVLNRWLQVRPVPHCLFAACLLPVCCHQADPAVGMWRATRH